MTHALAYLLDHPEVIALAVAVVRIAYAVLSHAVAPHPRIRAAVEAVAALGPDLLRASQQASAAVRGARPVTLDARHPDDDPAALIARAEAAERRVAELSAAAPASTSVARAEAP